MDAHFERLLEELSARSRAEIDQVDEAARAKAEAIAAASAARIGARRETVLASADEESRRARKSAVADARHRGRRGLLEAQHALVGRIVKAAHAATVNRLTLCQNTDRLHRRAIELLSYAGDGVVEVHCREPMARLIAPALARDARVRVVIDDDAPWGFTLVADEGRLSMDDTVDAWLESQRPALAIEVCRAVEAER